MRDEIGNRALLKHPGGEAGGRWREAGGGRPDWGWKIGAGWFSWYTGVYRPLSKALIGK